MEKLTTNNRQLITRRNPLVSVIMPVYNGSRFVGHAIQSIVNQTYPRLELIVVSDGSSDATWKILKEFRRKYPKKVRIYRLKQNAGESAAANFAYRRARGQFIARMDADDVSYRQRIAKQVEYLLAHPEVIVLGTQASVIDKRGRRIGGKHFPTDHETIYRQYAVVHPMLHPSVMFRRSLLPRGKLLYRDAFEPNDDYYTLFDLLNYGQFANLPEQLVSYRIHGANKSLQNLKQKFWTITKIRIAAITRLNYQAPLWVFPLIALQAILVLLLPERVLGQLLLWLRGMREVKLNTHLPVKTGSHGTRYGFSLR